jgi:hypothetical protein
VLERTSTPPSETINQVSSGSDLQNILIAKCIDSILANAVSSLMMTREQAIHKRQRLAAQLSSPVEVLRGSLLQRTVHHSSGCQRCARGEGHPLWILTVGYPGGKTRQVSLRPDQVPQVRKALQQYRKFKRSLEAISELNQFLLRLDREESKEQERQS